MRRATGALLAGLLTTMVTAVPEVALAADDPQVPLATRLAARTHPAVQLVTTRFGADVVVPSPAFRQANVDKLFDQVAQDAIDGKIARDQRTLVKTAVTRMNEDVDRYLEPTSPERVVKAETTALCTGWWVTADGNMVTGAHCVLADEKVLGAEFAKQAQRDMAAEDQQIVKAILKGVSTDDELKEKTTQLITKFNSRHLELRNKVQTTTVLLSEQGGGVDRAAKAVPAQVIAQGESYPGKDVAILKVSGQQNLPTLELGADTDAQVGSTLYIDGFPGTVTTEQSLSESSRLQPTFTQGPYNAQRTTNNGVPYIQTQAPAYGGNSGGPVLSDNGKVMGILIATLGDGNGGAAQNEQLVLPVSVVKQTMDGKGIKAQPSTTMIRYNAGLDHYFKRHYKKALPEFRAVQALNPGHPYVGKYISDTQAAISAGKDQTPMATGKKLAIGGGSIAAVLLLAGLVFGFITLNKRRQRRPAMAGPDGWPGQYDTGPLNTGPLNTGQGTGPYGTMPQGPAGPPGGGSGPYPTGGGSGPYPTGPQPGPYQPGPYQTGPQPGLPLRQPPPPPPPPSGPGTGPQPQPGQPGQPGQQPPPPPGYTGPQAPPPSQDGGQGWAGPR